ncbi:hypothetical protein JGS22_009195 [Streptomyces sp. P38-E01]|uniref:Uncharacterized protein n=1 Tax=Streptomyces tardus TaxID=2780544 RepID=A0A949JKB5_9ACTN|nr:hypothetical protein [Streptomyces tardus]MBU7597789.1 hypothetical protein [Streptomyces tardus]
MSVPPPPPGGFPQGNQPGQPYGGQPGQPPQGGMPPQGGGYGYPQQGGQPPYGQPYGQPGAPQGGIPGQQPPQQSSPWEKFKKIKTIVVGIVVVAGLSLAAYGFLTKDDAEDVAAGDCLRNTGSNSEPDIEKLDCSDSEATHKVLKKIEGSSLSFSCNSVEGTVTSYTQQKKGDSFVLCLGPAK